MFFVVRMELIKVKRVLNYASKYWQYYLVGFCTIVISVALDLFSPKISQRIIDEVVLENNLSIFSSLVIMLLCITLGRAILGYIKEITFDTAGSKTIVYLRQSLFNHIQSLSYDFFESRNTGELMSRIKEDVDKVWEGISFGIMLVIEIVIYFVLACVLMFRISPRLALICIVTVPIIGYLGLKLERKIGKVFEDISEENAKLNTIAQENIAGVRLVKAFAREKYEINKFLKSNKQYYELNMNQARVFGRYFPKIKWFTTVIPIMVVVFGGAYVMNEQLSIGTLIQFNMYVSMILFPMEMLGWLSSVISQTIASAKKIDNIFDEEPSIKNKIDAVKLNKVKGNIAFENVSLRLNNKDILKNVTFEVKKGKTVGIMGATGAGKTSIINLLIRYYDVTEGNILIDGQDIRDIDIQYLRENISLVMQDIFLFSDTIKENITFGSNQNEDHEKLIDIITKAQAYDFVSSKREELETIIGEKGIGLSGGQKQRISIARALAKKAPILILDDSTSALDMETELKIQKSIQEMKNTTKIIIGHRISAVKNADEIIILDDGKIVERGNHDSLLKAKGKYYEIYIEQYESVTAS